MRRCADAPETACSFSTFKFITAAALFCVFVVCTVATVAAVTARLACESGSGSELADASRSPAVRVDLVVAYCTENIDWLSEQVKAYDAVWVYSKCGRPLPWALATLRTVHISYVPQIGSCDYAFLHHITVHWHNLSDLITFGKGTDSPLKTRVLRRRPGCDMHVPYDRLAQFRLQNYRFSHNNNSVEFHRAPFSLGEWFNMHDLLAHAQNTQQVAYGGHFSARSVDIRKTSRETYRNMMSLMTHVNEEVDHYMERTWGVLMTAAAARPRLCALTVFKNEDGAISEWLAHHVAQGVDEFFLIDNGSDQTGWKSAVRSVPVSVVSDERRFAQTDIYNTHIQIIKSRCDWVAVIDMDEFMYARPPHHKLPDAIAALPESVPCVRVRGKQFGSSGHVHQPPSIVHGFRGRAPIGFSPIVKSLVRTAELERFGVHNHDMNLGPWHALVVQTGLCHGAGAPFPLCGCADYSTDDEGRLREFPIHMNHYQIQSNEWFEKVKMRRGDVHTPEKNGSFRSWSYFNERDVNSVHDPELSSLSPTSRKRGHSGVS